MWRQGDIYFAPVDAIPQPAVKLPHCVLAEGEVTGHMHCVSQAGAAELFQHQEDRFLRVLAESATVVHQEHRPITLSQGTYRVWQQREYTPQGFRTVQD